MCLCDMTAMLYICILTVGIVCFWRVESLYKEIVRYINAIYLFIYLFIYLMYLLHCFVLTFLFSFFPSPLMRSED